MEEKQKNERVSVKEAAGVLGMNLQGVREHMKRGLFNPPIGYVTNLNGRYTYLIYRNMLNRKRRGKATPEQMRRQNEYNQQKKLRRLIKANFGANDYWTTETYRRGKAKTVAEAKRDKKKFLDEVRSEYKKRGHVLKWIGRIERGKRGAIHLHFIFNRIPDTDIIIAKAWKKIEDAGRVDFQLLYEKGQFKELAAYLTKPDGENEEGIRTTESRFSHSRNLTIPRPKVSRTTRKKILEEPVPTPGYYIDKDSICQGINPITGREYLHYIEIRLKEGSG